MSGNLYERMAEGVISSEIILVFILDMNTKIISDEITLLRRIRELHE